MIKWVVVWERVPMLDGFGKVFDDWYSEVGRLLEAYGVLSPVNIRVYSPLGKELFDEFSLWWDVGEEDWNGVFKPLLIDYGFTREAEYFEGFVGRDDVHWVIRRGYVKKWVVKSNKFTSSVIVSYKRPFVYLVRGVDCGVDDVLNLVDRGVLKPVVEYVVPDGFPPVVRYLFKVNRTNRKLFPCDGVKPGTVVVVNLELV